MPIYLIGEDSRGGPPFGRTFFETKLGELIESNGKKDLYKLTLYLTDGTTLDVCQIDEHSDQYMLVKAYQEDDRTCDMTVNLIPYGLIYRVQIIPKGAQEEHVGFRWTPPAPKSKKSSL